MGVGGCGYNYIMPSPPCAHSQISIPKPTLKYYLRIYYILFTHHSNISIVNKERSLCNFEINSTIIRIRTSERNKLPHYFI